MESWIVTAHSRRIIRMQCDETRCFVTNADGRGSKRGDELLMLLLIWIIMAPSNGQNLFLSQRDPVQVEEGAVKGFHRESSCSLLVVWMEMGRRGEQRRRGDGMGGVHKWKGKTTRTTDRPWTPTMREFIPWGRIIDNWEWLRETASTLQINEWMNKHQHNTYLSYRME